MKGSGIWIYSTASGNKPGLMGDVTKATIPMAKSQVMERTGGGMETPTWASGRIITSMGKVLIAGLMERRILEIGNRTKWTARVSMHGRMGGPTKEGTQWARNLAMGSIHGLMEKSLKGIGEMVSSTGKGP